MTDQLSRHTGNVRNVIRTKTDNAHAQLHLHSSFVNLFKGTLSVGDYRLLIRRFHGFYAPLDQAIEETIACMGQTSLPYAYMRRSVFLAQDVIDLGFGTLCKTHGPHCLQARDIVSSTTLGGVLYVIEGATLGASQIDRAAQKLLGNQGLEGRRFWAWCRAQNKKRWSMANSYIEQEHARGVALDDLVQGATDTFELLSDWLAPLDQTEPIMREVLS